MGIKKHLQIIAVLLVSLTAKAQQNAAPVNVNSIALTTSEAVYVHFNATSFVTGETLFYKIYSINPSNSKLSDISKVAYIELLDSKKNSVFKHKLFLKNGSAQSDFTIPANLQTGDYKFVAYTSWMQNKEAARFFEQPIYVINPYEPTPEANLETSMSSGDSAFSTAATNNRTGKSGNLAVLNLDKNSYAQRSQVLLNIQTSEAAAGNYSISVRKKDSLPAPTQVNAEYFSANLNKTAVNSSNANRTLPEFRGELISGKIKSNNAEGQIQSVPVALSIPGTEFIFKIVRTNKNGEFFFSVDKSYQSNNLVVQIVGEKRNDFSIVLNPKKSIDYSEISIANNLKINPKFKSALVARSVASQIENAYFSKKTDSITALKKSVFYDPNSKEYRLDDYTRFPTLKQTITEVVKEMHYSRNKGKYYFYLKDPIVKNQIDEPAITLVDGILVPNVSDIIDYNAKEIEKINIIPQGYIYGGTVSGGIISIFTKNGDFSTDKITGNFLVSKDNAAPEVTKTYFQKSYDTAKTDRTPDFRYQLLWLPDLHLDKTQHKLSFYTSDVPGIYEISMEGFTNDGKPIAVTKEFEVK